MSAVGSVRRAARAHPFVVAELALVGLMVAAGVAYVWQVLAGVPGAWTTANTVLAAAGLLGLVLVGHGVVDIRRLLAEDDWPGSAGLAVAGALWRLLELGLVVALVAVGLLTGAIAGDPPATSNADAAGTLGVILAVSVLLVAAAAGGVALLVVARGVRTLLGGNGAADEDGDDGTGDRAASSPQ